MTAAQPASDEQWQRLRADLRRLVARRVAGSADVDDIVQEVLIRVWRYGGQLHDDERFGGWLSRVVSNAVFDQQRTRGARMVAEHRMGQEPVAGAEDTPSVKQLIAAILGPFIAGLPAEYREAITLSELDGLSQSAIASRLGLSVSGIKSRVQRGRKLLRGSLERCCAIALDARGAPLSCAVRPDGVLPAGCCQVGADGAGGAIGCAPKKDGRVPH